MKRGRRLVDVRLTPGAYDCATGTCARIRQEGLAAMMTILIIDDSMTNRKIYSRLAASLQADVRTVCFDRSTAALEWLEANSADLVITDFKMPQMDGATFTRRLRERSSDGDIPVIVVTAYSDHAFRMEALEAGATDFLLTPVDHYEFVARARNLLKLRSQQRIIQARAETLQDELVRTREAHEALARDSREALAEIIDTMPALISATARDGSCLFVNEGLARFVGRARGEAERLGLDALFGEAHGLTSQALNELVFETGVALASREETLVDGAGQGRTFLTARTPLRRAGAAVVGVLTTSLDITERKAAEERLSHLAHHDTLTDLPNRALLRTRLRQALARGRRGDRSFALHFIDLDRFKAINDALGHHFGDQVLVAVGERLTRMMAPGDTVARLGGDEFAILQCGVAGPDDAEALAGRIIRDMAVPLVCEGQEVTIGASIGVTIHPRDGAEEDDLLRNADLAMYRAKAAGRDTWRFFAEGMNPGARDAMRTEADLRNSVARGELVLHYQPQVDLATGRIVGAAALLRWARRGHGLVPPGSFIALAEETGLILVISEWVLRESCRQAAAWHAAGLGPIRLGVNLSPVQFRRQDVFDLVVRTLAETGLAPELLELELTENILMENADDAVVALQRLRSVGVMLSVDDFGTGYSSLSYVKRFPINRLKIDQSFVRGLGTEVSDTAIVQTILELGHLLDLKVIAEGIESEAQMTWLRQEGCEEGQGFHFSRPVPAAEFEALLRRQVAPAPAALAT